MPFCILNFNVKGESNMKVKKWLLALVAFAVMAVLFAVGAGAEKYGDY